MTRTFQRAPFPTFPCIFLFESHELKTSFFGRPPNQCCLLPGKGSGHALKSSLRPLTKRISQIWGITHQSSFLNPWSAWGLGHCNLVFCSGKTLEHPKSSMFVQKGKEKNNVSPLKDNQRACAEGTPEVPCWHPRHPRVLSRVGSRHGLLPLCKAGRAEPDGKRTP